MTLIGAVGLLRLVAMIAASPEARQRSGLGVGKHGRAIYNASAGRVVDRNFDHVDPK